MDPDKIEPLRAWEFLKNNRLATLATVTEAGTPQTALIYYVTDENFKIFIIASAVTNKVKNILKNNHVALCIGTEKVPQVLQIEGIAEKLDDPDKSSAITKRYLETANKESTDSINWPPVMKIPTSAGFIPFEITITKFKFSDFSGTTSLITEGTSKDWE